MEKIKLSDVLIKKTLRLKDVPEIKDPLVLGVTNNEGVVISKIDAGQKVEDYFVIEKGDFVYNPYRINVGSIGISELNGITSLAYVVFNVDETKLNKYLLYKILKSDFGIKEIVRNGRGSVRNALRFDDLAKIELTLPPIEKQNKFIQDFKKKEEKIYKLKKNFSHQLSLLENLNQAILQEAVQGKLVPQNPNDEPASELLKRIASTKLSTSKTTLRQAQGSKKFKELPPIKAEEIPFEIPNNWVWCRLGDLRDFKFTLSYGVLVPGNEIPEGIPFVRVQDLDFADNGKPPSKRISPLIEKKFAKTRLVGGEILICVVGSIGKVALSPDNWIGANIARAVCRFMPNSSIDRKYIYYCLISPFIQNFFLDSQKSINPTLNVNILETTLIPLPPLSEQQRIVAEIEKQLEKTQELKAHILANRQATEQLLKALLQGAFEGEEKEN